ncbi:MAG: lysylphosphatidylglycerol synthase domain-containing protein, partial [Stellaceae bacterium]
MRFPTIIAWLAGLGALAALIAFNDPARLADGIATLRWWLLVIIAWHALPLAIDARAWQLLYPKRPPLAPLALAIWIGEGVNGLFPIPHLGEIARARIARHTAQPGEAAATVVVDLTLGVATELIFALLGVALLATWSHKLGAATFLAPVGAVIAAGALVFYLLQRAGLFALAVRIAHRWSET